MSAQEMDVYPVQPMVRPRRARFDLRRDGLRLAAVLVGLLAVDLLLFFWLVQPVRRELAVLAQQKLAADQTERAESRKLEQLRAVDVHATDVDRNIRIFYEDMLSTKRDRLVPFQAELMDVGAEFNVAPRTVAIGSAELEDEGLESLALSFPLTGGYENLRNFLARLEVMDQFLLVREVALTSSKEGGRALQLNVVVETYFSAPDLRERLAAKRERLKSERDRRRPGRRK